ncbi:MAG: type II toxin-antitoxin system RelE/ParE family toxin [Bacteroides sp.]|nr:type II toxin-antitoxin system RelE/ParE family toxin [Eubacterium sp.]MCM1418027.1 type II toxin-antitoxin system RelE/ParE family toxin [Roseburia sp.]MCM1462151.1 type II toxin-antitoxin system RelE/ParE family toxin [Bacteroides sp.]
MQDFEIIFYDKPDGTEPAREFILSLDKKMKARMIKLVDMLEKNGSELRMPYSKHIDDGIFELRAKVGSDTSRVLYFFIIGSKAVLTNGFIKKKQKTPQSEIKLAKKYRNEFLNREEK